MNKREKEVYKNQGSKSEVFLENYTTWVRMLF